MAGFMNGRGEIYCFEDGSYAECTRHVFYGWNDSMFFEFRDLISGEVFQVPRYRLRATKIERPKHDFITGDLCFVEGRGRTLVELVGINTFEVQFGTVIEFWNVRDFHTSEHWQISHHQLSKGSEMEIIAAAAV